MGQGGEEKLIHRHWTLLENINVYDITLSELAIGSIAAHMQIWLSWLDFYNG